MAKKAARSSSPHACPPGGMPHQGQKESATGTPAWKQKKQTQGKRRG